MTVSRRLIVLVAATVLVSGTCIGLGAWQLGRLSDRRAFNNRLVQRAQLPPLSALPSLRGGSEDPSAYRLIRLEGEYDQAQQLILRARSLNDRPGNHVLTPLRMSDGRAVIVDRGWVPLETNSPSAAEVKAPAGRVAVSGVLVPSESPPRFFGARDPGTGRLSSVARIDIPRIAKQVPYAIEKLALVLISQTPPAGELPLLAGVMPPGEGSHRAYAVQWFIFATIAVITGGLLMLRERTRPGRRR